MLITGIQKYFIVEYLASRKRKSNKKETKDLLESFERNIVYIVQGRKINFNYYILNCSLKIP